MDRLSKRLLGSALPSGGTAEQWYRSRSALAGLSAARISPALALMVLLVIAAIAGGYGWEWRRRRITSAHTAWARGAQSCLAELRDALNQYAATFHEPPSDTAALYQTHCLLPGTRLAATSEAALPTGAVSSPEWLLADQVLIRQTVFQTAQRNDSETIIAIVLPQFIRGEGVMTLNQNGLIEYWRLEDAATDPAWAKRTNGLMLK